MDHLNLQEKEVEEAKEVSERVDAIVQHRLKSVPPKAEPAHGCKEKIKGHRLRFRRERRNSVHRSSGSGNFHRRE